LTAEKICGKIGNNGRCVTRITEKRRFITVTATEHTLRVNFHTHTPRCFHAQGTEREYIEEAIAAGIRILGFSDHAPMVFPPEYHSGFRMPVEQTREYAETLAALREEYRDDITIYIGYEMEYYPKFFDASLANICTYPVDYLILGQHFIGNEVERMYSGAYTEDGAYLGSYVDGVIEGLGTGVYSYLAHPDLPNFGGDAAVYDMHMRRLCEAAKRLAIPLEINFLGLREHRQYPCDRFWSIAAEVGCQAIFGCDAHSPDMLSDRRVLRDAYAYAEKFGLTVTDTPVLRSPHGRRA